MGEILSKCAFLNFIDDIKIKVDWSLVISLSKLKILRFSEKCTKTP